MRSPWTKTPADTSRIPGCTAGSPTVSKARVAGAARRLVPGSEAEFIAEHYWGYTKQRGGGTKEYRVDHPSWLVWDALESSYECPPTETLYGPSLTKVLGTEPKSAFVALGSEVRVFPGVTV